MEFRRVLGFQLRGSGRRVMRARDLRWVEKGLEEWVEMDLKMVGIERVGIGGLVTMESRF